ncbi:MAG TPA: hypothetical protein VFD19_04595 [Clostridia bacterium]|nr:hypothetical protein [Clostridia bacterium]
MNSNNDKERETMESQAKSIAKVDLARGLWQVALAGNKVGKEDFNFFENYSYKRNKCFLHREK